MAFNTAITGLKASTINLDVTGNNIANASTVGFKSGRTEFADIFTTVVVGAGSTNNPGAGVIVSDIAQDFTAGTIEFTNNNLDLAIDGSGFFQLDDGQGGITYTRAGGFELDKDGNVVSKNGKFLQGYGLDAAGNQLPIGTLAVSEKENPPRATSEVDLSFNIDSRDDANGLLRPYDPDESASFSFSTTTRIFDSLGNENTVKLDLVEQPAVRERQTIAFTPAAVPFPDQSGATVSIAGASLTLSTGAATPASAFTLTGGASSAKTDYSGANDLSFDVVIAGHATDDGTTNVVLNSAYLDLNDVALDIEAQLTGVSVSHDGTSFVFTSDNPGAGNITIQNYGGSTAAAGPSDIGIAAGTSGTAGADAAGPSTITTAAEMATDIAVTNKTANLAAIRTQDPRVADIGVNASGELIITFAASAANVEDVITSFPSAAISTVTIDSEDVSAAEVQSLPLVANPAVDGTITIGSGTSTYTLSYSATDTTSDILNRFRANQSAITSAIPEIDTVDADITNNRLLITYRDDLGDVSTLAVAESGGATTGGITATTVIEDGDNSFEGVYQMYAYLNGTDLLDIGKESPPGTSGDPTEPGPVIITFNNATGELQSVNGDPVSAAGIAPRLTILNADPANADTEITMDLSGTTQFASESIVKSATQDGYTKGDLIGVTFAEDGTMVASFSNGQNSNLGIVALATFENQGGLQPTGNTEWSATLESGQAILNPPGTGLNGSLRSAALEQSNVDLSEELVALIEAQRNFQANSRTLQTENAVTQAILQIQ